jgi:hypothetical protein
VGEGRRSRGNVVAHRTLIQLHATLELPGIAALAGPVAVRAVKRGMGANLAALKAILER